ncbi:MAG TPA: hypothetical protein VGI78_09720 [Acetobacteraceae bacterium]|jgi:hypothetical protein
MPTLRTTLNPRKYDARRLMARGYEILHIETRHRDEGAETEIVWIRPPRPDDVPEHDCPTDAARGWTQRVQPLSHVQPGAVHCFRTRLFGAAFSPALTDIDEPNQIRLKCENED